MKVKPISPADVEEVKAANIPDFVFEVFNEWIAKKWNGTCSRIDQDEIMLDIMAEIEAKGLGYSRNEVYDNYWLDVEEAYRSMGWKVVYDKPGYCEAYAANFKFSK